MKLRKKYPKGKRKKRNRCSVKIQYGTSWNTIKKAADREKFGK